eukprot:RCo052445
MMHVLVLLATLTTSLLLLAADGLPGGGTSLAFSNDKAAAVIPDFTFLSGASNYSMEAWVYSTSSALLPSVLTFAIAANVEFWTLSMGDQAFFSLNGQGHFFSYIRGFAGWRHVAMTVADRDIRCYVNGELVAQHNWTAPPFPGSAFFVVSKYPLSWDAATLRTSSSLSFFGFVDEVRLWNTTVPHETIRANLHRRIPEDTPNLVVQWHFDDLTDSPDGLLALSAQG